LLTKNAQVCVKRNQKDSGASSEQGSTHATLSVRGDAVRKMSFDDEQDFSPFCHDGDDILDELLGTPPSECIDCASPLDGGQSVTDESSSKSDRASSNRYGKDARRGKARRSSSDSGSKAKHPVSVGRRNERERNRVKQVSFSGAFLCVYWWLCESDGGSKMLVTEVSTGGN
jgi:hypothetical protein